MNSKGMALVVAVVMLAMGVAEGVGAENKKEAGWIQLFNGKNLDGWKASERKGVFTVEKGLLKVDGPRSHLFYAGKVNGASFKNFELVLEIKTMKGANSGIYVHTQYQEKGWPGKGFEIQVNNTHRDKRKGGGIYAVKDNAKAPAKDGEWYTQHIMVKGNRIVSKVNGKVIADWTQPKGWKHPQFAGRKIDKGTIAIQGHDPKSVVYYRKIAIKPLP